MWIDYNITISGLSTVLVVVEKRNISAIFHLNISFSYLVGKWLPARIPENPHTT